MKDELWYGKMVCLASLPDRAWEQGWWCVGKCCNYLLHKNRLMCTSFVCVHKKVLKI